MMDYVRSVLIVGDDVADNTRLSALLQTPAALTRYSLSHARSCEHALTRLRTKVPDCCLLVCPVSADAILAFLKSLRRRKLHETMAIIIIAESQRDDIRTVMTLLRQGVQDYLLREDVTTDYLIERIDTVADKLQSQKKLAYLAHHDDLTGLLDREFFLERLQQSIKACKKDKSVCSLLYIDVDNFKQVNDFYGHDVGDSILIKLSEQIKRHCRTTDSAARIGGDEFAVIINSSNVDDVSNNLALILKKIAANILLEAPSIDVSLSVGVAHYPETAGTLDELLKQADNAMYSAKKAGKARYVQFSQAQRQQWERRNRLEGLFPDALANGELTLGFQPVVSTDTGDLFAIRAEANWSPGRYKVSTQELLAIIERLNLYEDYYQWLFECICEHIQNEPGLPESIPVKLAIHKFQGDGLIHALNQTLVRYDVRPQQIAIELTETALIQNPLQIPPFIKSLKSYDYGVTLVGFTASYQSMELLRKLPVDVLSVDSRCVADLEASPEKFKTLEVAALFAHHLNMKVVVDGVTSQEIHRIVKAVHCDLMQGDYCGSGKKDLSLLLPILPVEKVNHRLEMANG